MEGRSLRTMIVSVALVASMLLCVPLVLDSKPSERSISSSTTSELRIGALQVVDSMNPYAGVTESASIFYGLVYDTLTSIGTKLETVPNLATSYYPVPLGDPDMVGMPFGSVWQYNLTHNASWSDGEVFSADDVVYNVWLNAEATHYPSMWAYQPYSYYMHMAWKVDDFTVRISFWDRQTGVPVPSSYAPSIGIPMLPKHLLEMYSYSDIVFNWTGVFSELESPGMPIVGTGPFIATPNITAEWLAGDHLTLLKNPYSHWLDDYGKNVKFDRLVIRFFQDSTSLVLALKNNEIDIASYPPSAFRSIKNDVDSGTLQNVTVFDGPKINNYFTEIGFCMNNAGPNPSRLDPVIREALHIATNKQYIVDNYYMEEADVGSTLIPPENAFWHYEPGTGEKVNYNLSTAASLLESNGYRDVDFDGIRECTNSSPAVQRGYVAEGTELVYEMLVRKEMPEEKDTAMYLKSQWSQIGVVLNYLIVDEMLLASVVYSYNYDTMIWYWSGDVDPNYILFTQTQRAWNGWSDTKYYNKEYDENYTLSVETLDPALRKTFVENCQKIFYHDNAYIIMAYPRQTYAWRTDTFTGWGNWSTDPGRSLDNVWTGNPLFFDLVPFGHNSPPTIDWLIVNPNPATPYIDSNFTVYATDYDADALEFYIEFGDGGSASAFGWNTTGPQLAQFAHAYTFPGKYTVTVFVNDSYPEYGHNVSKTYQWRVLVGQTSWLEATVLPSTLSLNLGDVAALSADMTWFGESLLPSGELKCHWTVSPSANGTLGYFDDSFSNSVYFTAGPNWGSGVISCHISYYETEMVANATLTVNPPHVETVSISPSSATISPGSSYTFAATAISNIGLEIPGVEFTWSVSGDAGVTYSLNSTTGTSVTLTVGTMLGNLTIGATGSYGGSTATGYANITVGYEPPRKIDYVWYDMFNVPIGSWYYKRWEIYKQEEPISTAAPWLFNYHTSPEGNIYTYSLMRLNITGRNVSEVNMNERPEFLPMFSSTERGGTAVIDWYMQYLTTDELVQKYGYGIANQDDGWIIDLNGTVTLDEQAAKAVLNISDTGFDNFADWWATNEVSFNQKYADWLVYEAEERLDIEPAYESYFQLFVLDLNAERIGSNVVVSYDILTWGMEALMMRWLKDAFMPTEWYYEDMNFHVSIGPEAASIDIDTAVTYAVFADQSLNHTAGEQGEPCWRWQAMLGDAMPSSFMHPHSDYDPYESKAYVVYRPGSPLYGQLIQYDYTPGSWNLSDNETLKFIWPSGQQLFRYHVAPGLAVNLTDEMEVKYSEPMDFDFPGQVVIDNAARTITFTGPIDVFDWSKNQTSHAFLADEWGRLGGNLLPYGQPTVEFGKVLPVTYQLSHLDVDVLGPVIAGDLVTLSVTAMDQYGNVYESYAGTVNITSTDLSATMPANYTFTEFDQGVHLFVGELVFRTEGTQTVTVVDTSPSPLRNGSAVVYVLPMRQASYFEIGVYHLPTVDVAEDVTVTVYDQYGDVFVNYTGTVKFSTNRTGKATLPSDYAFLLSDAGVHTIVGGITFKDTGWFTVTGTDVGNSSVSGSQTDIMVLASPEIIDHFVVMGINDLFTLQRSNVTVLAYNQVGMIFQRYTGTIHFSANRSGSVLPADYTFQASDLGSKTLGGIYFTEGGVYTVTVADSMVPSATGSQTDIVVQFVHTSETFRMYDLFQQPWGEWWPWRYPAYKTDIILNNETGKYTMIYNPDMRGNQGIIYAPYRWNITARNLTVISMDNPEFMPVLGTPGVPGAEATVEIYFQYLSWDWWNDYWSPVWHFPDNVMIAQTMDGYYPGTTYDITMNRQAAEEWLGMPQTVDPTQWWYDNAASYIASWEAWILNEGNVRLDIWTGYEWPYVDLATDMKLTVLPGGDIQLQIGHLGEGYEILMTRWLSETQICTHEPYYEDMSLNVRYVGSLADLDFDAVCQYSLTAVLANESMTNEPAWAWEPQLIDYVASWNTYSGDIPSTYDPWANLTYQSLNAGDPLFKTEIGYDSGVGYFNLSDSQTFIIQLPTGNDNLGYYAQPPIVPNPIKIIIVPPLGSGFDRYPRGDGTNYDYNGYWPIMMNGSMSLGYYGNWSGPPNLDSMYNPVTKTLTMVGPLNFENTHHENGALYHGAPWIEFNVTAPTLPDVTPPEPVAEVGPNPANAGDLVNLSGLLSTDDVGIVDYNWSFIYDGVLTVLHGQVVYFAFLTPGIYNITLKCTDAAGNYNTTTVELVVNPLIPEFSSVVLVTAGFIAMFLVVRRFRRRS